MKSPTGRIWKRRCATFTCASARTICPCSSPPSASRLLPAAISAKFWNNLSGVIRQRFKMRRKVRALAAEGRASAMILSALPIGLFIVVQVTSPDFYASVWHEHLTKLLLVGGASWMLIGNLTMFKMVNFKI